MSVVLTVDWRFVVALGATACGIILSAKMDPEAAERVSIHVIDAFSEFAAAE